MVSQNQTNTASHNLMDILLNILRMWPKKISQKHNNKEETI
jgi:hypothetical protein